MRRFFIALVTLTSLMSCENVFVEELNAIHNEIDELRSLIDNANKNIDALQTIVSALQDKDYVTGVTPVIENGNEVGYKIAFSKSGVISIYHGKDGYTPKVGIRKDTDGMYYWTLDGNWLLDTDGSKISALGISGKDGITPKLKIDNDIWYISYDNGGSWNELGNAKGDKGDSMFSNISVTENRIIFYLADGSEFTIPRYGCLDLILDTNGQETGALPGRTVTINYEVINSTSKAVVSASSNGYYAVSVKADSDTAGRIMIDCPINYKDGYINIFACDESGYTVLKVINIYEEKMEFSNGLEYYISPEGGEVTIPFRSNFEYTMEVAQEASSWLSLTQTKSPEMKEGEIMVTASMNNEFNARIGKIYVYPLNAPTNQYTEIIINQASAVFSISQSKYAIRNEGDIINTKITSTMGLTFSIPEDCSWISSSLTSDNGYSYTLTTEVSENKTENSRNTSIRLMSGDGQHHLGTIEIVQVSSDEEDPNAMILKVRPNYINEFLVDLPLAGEYDCYIDWGDGVIEYCLYSEKPDVTHKYSNTEPESYTIRIVGRVISLDSRHSKSHSIEEIVQWGSTGLTSLNGAFKGNFVLKRITASDNESLSSVQGMTEAFCNCSSLEYIPSDLLYHCKADLNLEYIFSGCSSLTAIPEDLLIKQTEVTNFSGLFASCKKIQSIPEGLFRYNTKAVHMNEIFLNCILLETIPANLFANCPLIESVYNTFGWAIGLKYIPVSLFDNNRRITNFERLFIGCDRVEGESPYTEINGIKYHLYERCYATDYFYTPTSYGYALSGSFSDYDMLPDGWR